MTKPCTFSKGSCIHCGDTEQGECEGWNTPPKREWFGITKAEVEEWDLPEKPTVFEFAKFVESKLKELNT